MVYVIIIKDIYEWANTKVWNMCGKTQNFTVRIGVHYCSALSFYLFSLIMDEKTKDIHDDI